jgi:hypothetical protein
VQQQQAQLEHLAATQGGVGRGHDAGEVLEHELKRLERAREQHQMAEEQRREQHSNELATRKLQHSREPHQHQHQQHQQHQHGVTTTTSVSLGVQDLRDAALVLEQHARDRGAPQNEINGSSSAQACHINTTAPPPRERDTGVSRGVVTPPPESAAPTHNWHNSWGGGGGRACAWDSSTYSGDALEHRDTEEAEMLEESRFLFIYLFICLFIHLFLIRQGTDVGGVVSLSSSTRCMKALSRLYQGSLKALLRLYEVSIKALSRLYQGSIKARV